LKSELLDRVDRLLCDVESLERRADYLLGKGKKKKKEEAFVLSPDEWAILEEQTRRAASRKKTN
jgi:sarcosine oxidase gamma subunit